MADEIRADYTQLQQMATQFSRQATAINRMQQQMKHSLGGLQGNWIGHGSEAFFSEMRDKVLPATQRLADALRAAQKVTLQISQVLRAAEEDAARPFRRGAGLAAPGYASQHWSYDVHAGLTYYTVLNQGLALAVQQGDSSFLGLSAKLAPSIAKADASVDLIAFKYVGEGSGGPKQNATKWAQTPNSELGGQTPEEYYHYPTRDEATARLTAAILGKDPTAFGQALHGFQDYFSHTLNGFTAGPGNIEALISRCPECLEQGVPLSELIKRAREDGHSDSLWADLPNAPHRAEMLAGSEYWIRLFLLYYNGVIDQQQLEQLLSDSAATAPSD